MTPGRLTSLPIRKVPAMETLKEKLAQALARRPKQRLADPGRRPAAVLVPLYCQDGEYYVVFTRRSAEVTHHKRQISFPGGTCEVADVTPVATAFRECAEEIGLFTEGVELLGELDDCFTMTSSFTITPFVAVIPWPYRFVLDAREVEQVIAIPVSALLRKEAFHERTEMAGDRTFSAYYYRYRGLVIWGATAKILKQLLDIYREVVSGQPGFNKNC